MKRVVSLLLLSVCLLAACAPRKTETPAAARTAVNTPQPTHTPLAVGTQINVTREALKGITVQVWHPWFGVEANLFNSMVSEFNQQNQWGIQVAAVGQSNYTSLYDSVTAALPTARRPNLVIALPEQARAWDADGYVVDLTPYLEDSQFGWSEVQASDFAPVFWNQDGDGARQLAVPAQRSARFMLWNKTWANELGFVSPPASPEDFREQACRAHQSMLTDASTDNDAFGGWLIDTNSMTALSWLLAFDGGVLEGNGYRFLTPNNIASFTFIKELQEADCAWLPTADADLFQAFAARKALFVTADLGDFSNISRVFVEQSNADEWVALAFPGQTKSALPVYGSSFVILKADDAEQLASWLFVTWMIQTQNDAHWVKTMGFFPLRASTLNLLTDYQATHPQWAQAVDLISDGQVQPQLASWRKVRVMLGDGFNYMFRMNIPSGQIAAVLAQMESTSRDISK